MAELLFTSMGSKGKFKSIGKSKYKAVLEGVDSSLVWFTDRPDRDAGKVSFSDLISQWNDGFKGVNPNSALVFKDQNGVEDTVVFEQTRPKYNSRKNKLTFNLKVHNKQKLDLVSGALSDEARDADGVFTKKFSDFSLFIDNWFSKDTSVNLINDSNSTLEFFKIDFKTVDGRKLMKELVAAGALTVGAYFGCVKCAEAAVIEAIDVVTGLLFPDTQATIAYNNSFVLKQDDKRRITDVDTQIGFSNDVGDVAYHVQSTSLDPETGEPQIEGLGAIYFDNPTVGSPNAKIILYKSSAEATADFKTVTPWYPDAEEEKSWSAFNGLDFSAKYFGNIDVEGSSAKGWDLTFS